jgi:hypothetical protein
VATYKILIDWGTDISMNYRVGTFTTTPPICSTLYLMVLRNIPEPISRIDLFLTLSGSQAALVSRLPRGLMILILTLTEKPVTFSALVVI